MTEIRGVFLSSTTTKQRLSRPISHTSVRLFPADTLPLYRRIVALLDIQKLQQEGHDIRAAVASRTGEPGWARFCMNHLMIDDGLVLRDCLPPYLCEIAPTSKRSLLFRLHRKTGIRLEDMAFFDNEPRNIEDVSRFLPVQCFHTPLGMTRKIWEEAKDKFGI